MPTQGVLTFLPKQGVFNNMDHWEQYDWKFTAKRWGHYQVMLRYVLTHAKLTVQFKHGETRLKKTLMASPAPRDTLMGEVFIPEAGDQTISIYTPQSAQAAGFGIDQVVLVPANEGEPVLKQGDDGSVTLHAKDATTWSESMRYEPKPEKNCLGYWTSENDMAEWEFEVTKPGKFAILVSQGCDESNHGSEVEVKVADQTAKFVVQNTGGFQQWKDVEVGQVEIKTAGTHRLVIDPLKKAKSAVMDVQKVTLRPL